MKDEIIKTKLIENGKSSYLIDLLKNESNLYYFTITQNTLNTATRSDIKSITFRSNMINDLIEDLQSMKQELYKLQNFSKEINEPKSEVITSKKDEIIKRYFKGISLKDLSVQFNCTISYIEQVLKSKDIEIVSNEVPKNIGYRSYKRKRK